MPDAGAAVEVVPPQGLAALEGEWTALWHRCPQATPFQAPAWLLPWARHYAPDRCGAAILRAGGRLVGIVPVFCWEGALLLAGTGPSDRGDALIEPGFEAEAPRLLRALPQAAPEPFDRIDLQQLAAEAPLLRAERPEGWEEERRPGEACLVAPLNGEEGLGAASLRQRSNWRQALRRLEREGGAVSLAAPDEIGLALDDLLRLNALRWGEASVLSDRLLRALLRDAAPALSRAGLLRLHEVRLGGQRIAALLVLAGSWAHHYYNGGFDPGHAKLSPSMVLVGAAMRQAAREGAGWFDFLRGHEPYKRLWGAEPLIMHRRVLHRPG